MSNKQFLGFFLFKGTYVILLSNGVQAVLYVNNLLIYRSTCKPFVVVIRI